MDLMRRWATLPAAALVVLALVVAGAIVYAVHHERSGRPVSFSDAAKNERLLRQLVPPAEARVASKTAGPSYESTSEISERKLGYATDVEYEVPKGTKPRAVAEAYAKQLRGWKRHEEVIPCEQVDAGDVPNPCQDIIADVFKKGDVEVSLNLDSFDGPPPWGYELTIMQR